MSPITERVAAAPISWGVSEVPGWGYQMEPMRVLREMMILGFQASEMGPNGYFAGDEEVRQAMRSSGFSIMAGFVPLGFDPKSGMTDSIESLRASFSGLKRAGAELVVLAISGPTADYESRPNLRGGDFRMVTQALIRVKEIAGAEGLRAVLHPHFGTLIESARDALRVVDGSGVGLCLDTGHLALAGDDPADLVSSDAARINHVHLKDINTALADQVRQRKLSYRDAIGRGLFRPLGQGDLDVEKIVAALEASGYTGRYVLEQDIALSAEPRLGEGPSLEVTTSLEFLSRTNGKHRIGKVGGHREPA